MIIWLAIGSLVSISFILFLGKGSPYLPSKNKQMKIALDMLSLKEGDVFVDVGCGDGQILLAAAKHNVEAVGYEINPIIWAVAKYRTKKYSKIDVRLGNFWNKTLPPNANAVFAFQHSNYMQRIADKISDEVNGACKLVSFNFEIPGRHADSSRDNVYLYKIND